MCWCFHWSFWSLRSDPVASPSRCSFGNNEKDHDSSSSACGLPQMLQHFTVVHPVDTSPHRHFKRALSSRTSIIGYFLNSNCLRYSTVHAIASSISGLGIIATAALTFISKDNAEQAAASDPLPFSTRGGVELLSVSGLFMVLGGAVELYVSQDHIWFCRCSQVRRTCLSLAAPEGSCKVVGFFRRLEFVACS